MSSPQNERPSQAALAAAILAAIVVVNAVVIVARLGAELGTLPIDACYYIAKANSFAETLRLRVPWGNGIDAKFLPGLSIALALPLKVLGYPWGWIAVETASLAGAAWLTGSLAKRLGAGAVGAACAAAAFAADPLVIKWASVPYAEIPAVFLALASIELAFRARDARRRWAVELAAALLLGAAAATRLEALIAAPALLAIAASGRGRGEAARAGAALSLIVGIPIAIHLASMAALGVAPARLHYVGELARKFELAKVLRNLGAFFAELSHLSPPKRNVLADLPESFDTAQTAARIGAFALTLVGAGAFLARPCRGRGAAALALLLVFPVVHSLWHYTDGRFLLLVWPVVAAAEGRGAEALLARAPRAVAIALAALLALAAGALLALGFSIANKEIGAWKGVTGGSARALAARIDGIVGEDTEGIYELEMDSPPIVASGPFVAAFRRAPARFAYDHDEFFAADVPREGVAALLGVGKRFVLTNLPFDVWLSRRVSNPAERDGYLALIQESGRTLITKK